MTFNIKKIAISVGLSLAYTMIIILILTTEWYRFNGFWLRFTMGLLYFSTLSLLYFAIYHLLDFAIKGSKISFSKYIKGVLIFMVMSIVFHWVFNVFLFNYWQNEIENIFKFGQPERVVYYTTTIIAIIYFSIRCFFDVFQQLHQTALDVERFQIERAYTNLAMLKSQVSPHFLFNSLNALNSLIYTDVDKAARFIEELALVFRYVLENKDKELVSLRQELDFLNAYIYLIKIRFRENIQIQMQITAQYLQASIPPMTLQILLENAIKHNIVSKDEPLIVEISSLKDSLIMKNNLQLREKIGASTGVGLRNIIQRYKYLTEKEVNISQTQTEFIAKIPLLFIQDISENE